MRILMTLAFAIFASTAMAQGTHSHGDTAMSMGTIKKIDTRWNRLTIDHGPLANLQMDGMTMVFEVTDPALLDGLSEGQEIEFTADRVKGKLTVTEIKHD